MAIGSGEKGPDILVGTVTREVDPNFAPRYKTMFVDAFPFLVASQVVHRSKIGFGWAGELKKKLTGQHYFTMKTRSCYSKINQDIQKRMDKSVLVVMENPICQEKKWLEMKRNAKMDKMVVDFLLHCL